MIQIENLIGNQFQQAHSGATMDNFEPAKGRVYSTIPLSDEVDVEEAVVVAEKALQVWNEMGKQGRSKVMYKLADLIEENIEVLAAAESRDNGKPLALAKAVDIPRAAANIRFYATAILHYESKSHDMDGNAINYTLRKPIGIVGCISPWNLPLYLFTWKIAPALAAGNCVVAKPSEVTPMTAYLFSKLCVEAGMPAGVLNILHGPGTHVGKAITAHPKITAISFTGGTATGKAIASIAAPMFKKLSLELGGKNPNIIFDDCDFDKALETTVRSSFANQGQICLCGSRIFVQKGIYEKFRDAFVEKVSKSIVGPPHEKVHLGAVVSEAHMHKVLSYVDLAKEEGGKVLTGGKRFIPKDQEYANGWYLEPTIIEGLGAYCRTNLEEIFGPVVTIMPFETEAEVLAYANATEYGLASTIWTQDLTRAHRLAQQLHAGITWVNCWLIRDLRTPFGGVKNSGVGREGGFEALDFFTEPQNICININL